MKSLKIGLCGVGNVGGAVLKTLKSANADVFQAAVSSINVEVPGR